MFESFTPEALAVAVSAKALAEEMHYSIVGREHLPLGFASGAGGELIHSAFLRCGLTVDTIRLAIKYIDGEQRPIRPHRVKYVHQIAEMKQPYTRGVQTLITQQLFPYMSPNADQVFKMARSETIEDRVSAEEVLYVFLREVGRSDDHRRVVQVLGRAAPKLTMDNIKSAMLEVLEEKIAELVSVHGDAIIVDCSTLTEPQQEIARLKRLRHAFMYTGHAQGA